MEDIPYSVLKEDERTFRIMTLRDQYGNTFQSIGKEYGISVARVVQIYHRTKIRQARLYINHISIVLGYEDTSKIRKVYEQAYNWYQEREYACAYLEKQYKDILDEYRCGEPGMPQWFMKSMPPLRPELGKKAIARLIEMRENKKMSFAAIAKELRITPSKARHTYESFYHQKVVEIIKDLQEKEGNCREKTDIWERYFKGTVSAKRLYEELVSGKR